MIRACAWTLCLFGAAAQATAPELAPLPVAEALKTRDFPQFTSIAHSPDGQYIAYTLKDNARADRPPAGYNGNVITETGAHLNAYGSDVYITHLKTGELINASGGVGTSAYLSWSPDSKRLAFYSDRDGQTRVWTWELATRKLRRVSDALALPSAPLPPLWGDNGRKLLVSLLPEGMTFAEANRRASAQPHPAQVLAGSTVSVYEHETQAGGLSPAVQKLQGYDGFSSPIQRDLAHMDVATGQIRRLFPAFEGRLLGTSRDGRYAVATIEGQADPRNFNDALYDIVVLDMASGREAMRISGVPMLWGVSVSWAPSGHRFAYITGSRSEIPYETAYKRESKPRRAGDVFVVDVGGQPVNVSEGEHPSFSTGDKPIWSADGRAIYVMGSSLVWRADVEQRSTRAVTRADSARRIQKIAAVSDGAELWQPKGPKRLFVQVSNSQTLHEEFCVVDIDTGELQPVHRQSMAYKAGVGSALLFDAVDSKAPAVFGAQSATQPADLYITQDFSQVRRLTRHNPIFERYVMGNSRLIVWQDKAGKQYKGTLLLPAGYREGRRYPMVVWQRPSNIGSFALDIFGLLSFQNYQLLATRGYAVFYPDFPATSSRDVQEVAREVVFPGIDKVVELGFADKDRIGVTGTSWGGYSTLVLATMTDRFKAAVAESGPSNEFDSFSVMLRNGNAFRVQESMNNLGGTPWTARQTYIDTSPVFHLDKVTTPLMLIHSRGDDDYSIPQDHASQVFVGLRSLNKTVSMVIYHGGHGFAASSYVDQVEIWNRVIAWYERFLKAEKP